MKIEDAIAILEQEYESAKFYNEHLGEPACKLGIEALKRCKAYKEAHIGLHYEPMPGETEE